MDVERPAIFPKGRMIRYHQYKATPAVEAGVACLEVHQGWEAEYTDKFGRLTRGLQGWARRCVDHYEPESDLGGGRAVKEIRYYDENGELSSDHLMKCAIIRFSYPEHGFQQISYFDEHGRELKHFQKAREGSLEKEEPYSYYSMLNEDITCYEPDNRDEGEIIEREAD
ncbi:hypothetical protein ABFY27_16240 [Akkermansia massiliensis]